MQSRNISDELRKCMARELYLKAQIYSKLLKKNTYAKLHKSKE